MITNSPRFGKFSGGRVGRVGSAPSDGAIIGHGRTRLLRVARFSTGRVFFRKDPARDSAVLWPVEDAQEMRMMTAGPARGLVMLSGFGAITLQANSEQLTAHR